MRYCGIYSIIAIDPILQLREVEDDMMRSIYKNSHFFANRMGLKYEITFESHYYSIGYTLNDVAYEQ